MPWTLFYWSTDRLWERAVVLAGLVTWCGKGAVANIIGSAPDAAWPALFNQALSRFDRMHVVAQRRSWPSAYSPYSRHALRQDGIITCAF